MQKQKEKKNSINANTAKHAEPLHSTAIHQNARMKKGKYIFFTKREEGYVGATESRKISYSKGTQ